MILLCDARVFIQNQIEDFKKRLLADPGNDQIKHAIQILISMYKLSNTKERLAPNRRPKKVNDEILTDLYFNKGMSTSEISKKEDVGLRTVQRAIKKFKEGGK